MFFVDTGDGVEYHETAEAAKKCAEDWIDEYRTQPEWDEAVERVCWGEVREYAMDNWNGDFVEYQLTAVEKPDVCEHGIACGDWCEPCNKAYKAAIAEEAKKEMG